MEHGLQHQSALNRGVRVDSGCAGSAAQFRVSPPRDGGFIEPESQSASRDESSIVIAPISNTIPEYMVVFLSWAYRTGPVIFGNLQQCHSCSKNRRPKNRGGATPQRRASRKTLRHRRTARGCRPRRLESRWPRTARISWSPGLPIFFRATRGTLGR
jgi:hypothetical protein